MLIAHFPWDFIRMTEQFINIYSLVWTLQAAGIGFWWEHRNSGTCAVLHDPILLCTVNRFFWRKNKQISPLSKKLKMIDVQFQILLRTDAWTGNRFKIEDKGKGDRSTEWVWFFKMATIWPRLQGNYTQMDYSGRSRKVTLEDQIKKVSSAGHVYSFFFRVRVNFFQTLYLTILCFPTFFNAPKSNFFTTSEKFIKKHG